MAGWGLMFRPPYALFPLFLLRFHYHKAFHFDISHHNMPHQASLIPEMIDLMSEDYFPPHMRFARRDFLSLRQTEETDKATASPGYLSRVSNNCYVATGFMPLLLCIIVAIFPHEATWGDEWKGPMPIIISLPLFKATDAPVAYASQTSAFYRRHWALANSDAITSK